MGIRAMDPMTLVRQESPLVHEYSKGDIVESQKTGDREWCRARIEVCNPDGTYKVYFPSVGDAHCRRQHQIRSIFRTHEYSVDEFVEAKAIKNGIYHRARIEVCNPDGSYKVYFPSLHKAVCRRSNQIRRFAVRPSASRNVAPG